MEEQTLIKLTEDLLPLSKWDFSLASRFIINDENRLPAVIYDSNFCRVKIFADYPNNGRGSWDLRIFYGRLHAPDNSRVIRWNNGDCYCWHNIELMLKYLDGQSGKEAANNRGSNPLGVQKFLDLGLTGVLNQPEWLLKMHATVWDYYSLSFFEIFDLDRPELWMQYFEFVKEYYEFIKVIPNHIPPLYKIC